MYCVHWNTLNDKLAKKSLAVRRPATGLNELSWAHSCLHLSQIGGLDDGHALEAWVIPG